MELRNYRLAFGQVISISLQKLYIDEQGSVCNISINNHYQLQPERTCNNFFFKFGILPHTLLFLLYFVQKRSTSNYFIEHVIISKSCYMYIVFLLTPSVSSGTNKLFNSRCRKQAFCITDFTIFGGTFSWSGK